mmetsp:Transcript_47550/g.133875  ORF Transcript_47550/g.133875 Transcript_47550/m.133875 type:complete len:216 (+) Transcript_47550:788-1435(+)
MSPAAPAGDIAWLRMKLPMGAGAGDATWLRMKLPMGAALPGSAGGWEVICPEAICPEAAPAKDGGVSGGCATPCGVKTMLLGPPGPSTKVRTKAPEVARAWAIGSTTRCGASPLLADTTAVGGNAPAAVADAVTGEAPHAALAKLLGPSDVCVCVSMVAVCAGAGAPAACCGVSIGGGFEKKTNGPAMPGANSCTICWCCHWPPASVAPQPPGAP